MRRRRIERVRSEDPGLLSGRPSLRRAYSATVDAHSPMGMLARLLDGCLVSARRGVGITTIQ